MTTLKDLDELCPPDIRVKLKGEIYILPGDMPVELFAKIQQLAKSDASEAEMVETLYDELLGLFRYKQPKLSKLPIGMTQLVGALAYIYRDSDPEEKPAGPPRRSRSGGATRTGQRAKTTRSRSRT